MAKHKRIKRVSSIGICVPRTETTWQLCAIGNHRIDSGWSLSVVSRRWLYRSNFALPREWFNPEQEFARADKGTICRFRFSLQLSRALRPMLQVVRSTCDKCLSRLHAYSSAFKDDKAECN